jgi:AbiU2
VTDDPLARWRSWIDKDAIPEGWRKNLWDEFYAMLHRRETWRGYREMLLASPEDVQYTARWLTQIVVRNHLEVQALAIRRFADAGPDGRVVSFGKILAEIAAAPSIFSHEAADEARADLEELHSISEAIKAFADKEVAHLDRDHDDAIADLKIGDFDEALQPIGELWVKWYLPITGTVAPNEPPLASPWWKVLRLTKTDEHQRRLGHIVDTNGA